MDWRTIGDETVGLATVRCHTEMPMHMARA